MSHSIYHSLTDLYELFTAHAHKPAVISHDLDLPQLVNHVVDAVDPRMRAISKYAKKLSGPVTNTWEYLDYVANNIPAGPVLDKRDYKIDPRLKLLFESECSMQQLFNSISPLIDENENIMQHNRDRAYMLLCMEKHEHEFFGADIAGDIIRREVKQTSVTFSNRKFLSAGYGVESAKRGFKSCAFEGILKKIRCIIQLPQQDYKNLIERKMQLRHQLNAGHDSSPVVMGGFSNRNDYITSLHPELSGIEKQLTDTRIKIESPEQHLANAVDVLSQPEKYLKVDKQTVILSNMGIKLDRSTSDGGVVIDFAEVEIEQTLKRIAMIVSVDSGEVFQPPMH